MFAYSIQHVPQHSNEMAGNLVIVLFTKIHTDNFVLFFMLFIQLIVKREHDIQLHVVLDKN